MPIDGSARAPASTGLIGEPVRVGAMDLATLAWTALFALWCLTGGAPQAQASLIDLAFFTPLSLGVAAAMLWASRRSGDRRDRWAWAILAFACALRVINGAVWRVWTFTGEPVPAWADYASVVRCAAELVAIATFASATREGRDRVRWRLDLALVVIGVAVVEWYVALGPVVADLRSSGGKDHGLAAVAVLLTGVTGALLSGLLHLRRADAPMRLAALFLLAGYAMQAVPDTVQWHGSRYQAGNVITLWWWAVWLAKLAGARAVLTAPPSSADVRAPAPYRSGFLPYVFLAGVSATLWHAIQADQRTEDLWMTLSMSAVTLLLVARQVVERQDQSALAAALEADRAWFSALVQHSYDAVVLVDANGAVKFASPAIADVIGVRPDGEVTEDGLIQAAHPDDMAALRDAFARAGASDARVTCRFRSREGGYRSYELRLTDLRDDPRVGAVVVHGHDVTRATALAQRLREAEEVEALGVFAGGLAHDLNNVLTVIEGHVGLLLADVKPGTGASDELLAVEQAVGRGTRLTQALLGLSRRKEPQLRSVRVAAFLRAHAPSRAVVRADDTLTVRVDEETARHALTAALNGNAPTSGAAAPWEITASTVLVGAAIEEWDDLEPGAYIRLDCVAESPSQDAAIGEWDEGLDLVLARALLREVGGALRRWPDSDGAVRMSLFLPAGAS